MPIYGEQLTQFICNLMLHFVTIYDVENKEPKQTGIGNSIKEI